MARTRNRRTIISVSLLTAALVLAVSTGAWYFYTQQKNAPSASIVSSVIENKIPSLGACELITTANIRASYMGTSIIKINEGIRTGSSADNDETSEDCVFAFSTAKSTNNTLTVSVYPYTSTSEGETSKELVSQDWAEIGTSNPIAYFGQAKEDADKTTLYMVRSLPGSYNVLLTLRQPSDAIVFDQPNSLNFLVGIVTKVNYDVLTRSSEKASEAIEGGGPGAPPEDTVKEVGSTQ